MSAETLRAASRLMRERAEVATPGPWSDGGVWWEHWTDPEGRKCHTPWPIVTTGHTGAEIVTKSQTEADATHIASWHPAVALAVADWLEHEAEACDWTIRGQYAEENHTLAHAVATAYLGQPAPTDAAP